MAKSLAENAIIDFRCELHKLKTILVSDECIGKIHADGSGTPGVGTKDKRCRI